LETKAHHVRNFEERKWRFFFFFLFKSANAKFFTYLEKMFVTKTSKCPRTPLVVVFKLLARAIELGNMPPEGKNFMGAKAASQRHKQNNNMNPVMLRDISVCRILLLFFFI
jgi:hypothetical protein